MKDTKQAVDWFVERTSMHGVPSLAKSRSTKSKLFWGFVCFIGMGMFIFMLISLILKYFSYPTTLEIAEVSKGFVRPAISFCNMMYAPLLVEMAFAKQASGKVLPFEMQSLDMDKEFIDAISEYYNFLIKLYMMRENMQEQAWLPKQNQSDHTAELQQTLQDLLPNPEFLSERWFLTSMLLKNAYSDDENGHLLTLDSKFKKANVVYCGHRDKECNKKYMEPFVSFDGNNCYKYETSEGHKIRESDSQGLDNGITVVFMTGNKLLAKEFGTKGRLSIPGYRNTFHPSVGSEGIRLMIHDPEMSPYPSLNSIDIAPGMSTTIGLTSREITRLPYPYGDCSNTNIEADLIIESVKEKLGFSPMKSSGMIKSKYNPGACRSTCLLRHIWQECGCLMPSDGLPFVNVSLLCGRINITEFSQAPDSGDNSCFKLNNMFTKECLDFLKPLYSDFKCVQRVLKMQEHSADEKKERIFKCNCPVSCQTREYDMTVGTSQWPSQGPEIDMAYEEIVLNKIIPLLKNYSDNLTDNAIEYLRNESSRVEVMQNFARVTVYIKSLKVDKVAQIASYTVLDLISDIGGQLGLWVGISAITLCEIFGFLSLTIQTLWASIRGNDEDEKDAKPTDESKEQMLML